MTTTNPADSIEKQLINAYGRMMCDGDGWGWGWEPDRLALAASKLITDLRGEIASLTTELAVSRYGIEVLHSFIDDLRVERDALRQQAPLCTRTPFHYGPCNGRPCGTAFRSTGSRRFVRLSNMTV